MGPSNPFRLTWLLCRALVRGCYGFIVVAITILLAALVCLPLLAAGVAAYFWIWHDNPDWALYTYIVLFFISGPYMAVWRAMIGIQSLPDPSVAGAGNAANDVSRLIGALVAIGAVANHASVSRHSQTPKPAPDRPRGPNYRSEGRFICTNGELRDRHSGNFVGRIDANGRVTNGNGDYVGRLRSDGSIGS